MSQAKGALMQLLLQRNTGAYRAVPSPAAAKKMPFTRYGVGRTPNRQRDPSVSASPLPGKSGAGDATVAGPFASILDLRSIGNWLTLLLGVATVNKAVTKQPTNVTGVTILYAESTCTSGNGTLSFTNANQELTWQAQADLAAGTAVDVTAGGKFVLESGDPDHAITVIVAPTALPATDKTDADINVSATLKAHTFPFNLTDRPDALLELGHTDTGKYYRTVGAKVASLSYDVAALEQNIALNILAGAETEEAAAFDANPTVYTPVRSSGAGGTIKNGYDTSLGTITGGSIEINNGMQGVTIAEGDEGYGLIDQSEVNMSGRVRAVFDSLGAFKIARDNTSTRMRLLSQAASGANTFQLIVDIPNVEFGEEPITKEGKSGLYVDVNWMAHRDAADNVPDIILVNDVASY